MDEKKAKPRHNVSFPVFSVLLLVALISSLVLAGNPSVQAAKGSVEKGPIRIGVVLPLSGAAAESGQNLLKGFSLYMDEIHHKMSGRPVELLVENTESSPATAVAKFHKLIDQEKVPLLAGIYLSSELYAVAPVADAGKTPFLVMSAGADNVTQRKNSHWIVRTCYTGSIMAHPLGEYAYKTLGYKRIITLVNDYAYGYEVVGGFQRSFEQAGGKIVQKLWTPLGFTDFSETIKSMRKDADAVFMANVGQCAEIIPKQYHELGPKLPLLGNHTSFDDSVLPKVGEYVLGAQGVSTYATAINTPANKRFVKAYKQKYGVDPSLYAANGYLAAMWLGKAIDSIKGTVEDKEKLMEALREIELKDAPHGPISLDQYGQAVSNVYLYKVVKNGNQYENKIVHTFPAVSQFWTYNATQYMKDPPYTKDYPPCKYCTPAK